MLLAPSSISSSTPKPWILLLAKKATARLGLPWVGAASVFSSLEFLNGSFTTGLAFDRLGVPGPSASEPSSSDLEADESV